MSCFFSLMLSIGINDAYGVFQQHYQLNEFPDVSTSLISWIGTVQFLVMTLGGVFSGFLCEHFDTRLLNSVGALIMGVAFIGGSYCTTVPGLMMTQGFLYGLGAAFPFVAATATPAQWFTKHQGLATGIALSGSGVGGMWMTSSQNWGSNMDTLMNGLSVVGRLAVGFLADITGPLNLMILNTVLASVALLVFWLPFESVAMLYVTDLLFGFAIGGIVSVIPVVAAQVFGLARLPSIMGLLFIGYFIGGLLGVPPMSALLDNVGHRTNYTSSIWYMGALPVCSLVFLLLMRVLITRKLRVKV
ncbi:MFS general substrate transporter [Linderina pennispora]|uniref:MFS general substrate transporter n=1 Tax=Linderina pennispora TaxID=61395 RepID=A0A1Y1VYF1_9FUNG|nr:MFS general substrate transporter [Linderina pennispora]ORX66289.1 MFS general substrate transporter [Linderina pennispora]